MANRTKSLEVLDNYMKEKGRVLTAQEYARETDTPIRLQQVRNIFGSWNKVEKLLMAREFNSDQEITDVDAVIRARNADAWEKQKVWREASENQDKKAQREAEAQHVAEVLALNAATADGANANKIAIGGPLPHEQADFTRTGATVTIDPVTKEQTVVDVEPELVTVDLDTAKTPLELKAAVAAEGITSGTPEVGHATDGGSTGKASIATANAMGDSETDEDKKTPAKAAAK